MNKKDIGCFIAEKRRAKNLTQEQIAELLGVSNKTVSKWETGKTMPDYDLIELLCKELDLSIPELLTGKELDSETKSVNTKEQIALLLYKTQHDSGSIGKVFTAAIITFITGILVLSIFPEALEFGILASVVVMGSFIIYFNDKKN